MALEIQILAWDRHTGMTVLNRLMGYTPLFYNWISNDITYIKCDLKGYYKCITLYSLYKK
jgi:hypothetical protein